MAFTTFEQARLHSEMIHQNDMKTATTQALAATADLNHADRIAAAAVAFNCGTGGYGGKGTPTAGHAQSWLTSGPSAGLTG
jgi:hypothetical protein